MVVKFLWFLTAFWRTNMTKHLFWVYIWHRNVPQTWGGREGRIIIWYFYVVSKFVCRANSHVMKCPYFWLLFVRGTRIQSFNMLTFWSPSPSLLTFCAAHTWALLGFLYSRMYYNVHGLSWVWVAQKNKSKMPRFLDPIKHFRLELKVLKSSQVLGVSE